MTRSGGHRDITCLGAALPCTGACLDTEEYLGLGRAVSAEQHICMTVSCSAEDRLSLLAMSWQATALACWVGCNKLVLLTVKVIAQTTWK